MSETKWTDEQQQAIDTRKCNLLVAAAAGSGKTAVLVERIIKIITNEENPVDIDKLLVVTFTSAAAAEMRERIAAAISKALEKNPNSKNLQNQLTLLSRANITTMHSFCLDVIKNYFYTIDLDPSFRIADETEITLMKNEIIEDIFEELYEEDNEYFKGLVEAYSTAKDDEKLKDIILNLYKFSMSGPWPERWLIEKAEEFNISTLEGLADIYAALNGVVFTKLKTVRKSAVADENAQETVKSIRDAVKKKIKSLTEDSFTLTPEESLQGIKDVYPYMKELSRITLDFLNKFNEKKREKNLLDFNDLEHLCLKILIDRDENNNIIPSSVAEHFKEFFDEVLVDEYQDSNNVQETIIDLVSRKNGDNPNVFMVGDVKQSIYRFRQAKPELFLDKYNRYPLVSAGRERKIQLYKNFRSRDEVLGGVNFIFKMVMSNVVGELEYTDDEALHLGAAFLENNDEDSEVGGNIELHMIDKSGNEAEEGVEEELQESEEEEVVDAISLEAKLVSKRIKELFETKDGKRFKVFDKETKEYRDVKYKDIVILLRATKNWSEIFLDELGAEGIPVYADTGSGYFESIEIRTIMSLLKIIDNPLQDVPMIAVLKSPIMGFTAEELSEIRLLNKERYFYEIIKDIYDDEYEVSDTLKAKCNKVISDLDKWRNKTIYTPIDEFIWYLYMDTAYYGYVGAMPNGTLRQANLKILFQRAKQYESTSFKGLFNFITFINKLRKSSGDMGSAKILGEHEDVVRIMSIHKSKGLEFPIVFTCGMGKQFNLMDLNSSILFHEELGFGPDFVNLKNRNSYSTLAKEAIKKRIRLETLSEEMRILYVAFTRAKEKLIITGATRNLDKSIKNWVSAASLDENIILPSEVLKGKSYLDWIAMAICKHRQGEELREQCGASRELIVDDFSNWDVCLWRKGDILGDKNLEPVDKIEENTLNITATNISVDKEIKRRLSYKYKYEEGSILPSNVSVSDLKRKDFQYEDEAETLEVFREREIIKPKFLQEEKGFTAAEKGTLMHYVMLRLDFDRVGSVSEIKKQIEELVLNKSLTEKEAKVIRYTKIFNFFKSDLGKRILKAHEEGRMVHRELPFFTEISSLNINPELNKEIYQNEKIRLQGIIDGFFKEEDGIVLFDYKTDYLEEGNEDEIIERYMVQMKYYKEALEKVTESRVKEVYLYLFALDKEVLLKV